MDIYEPLPLPETLDLAAAKRLRAKLLTEIRPYMLRRLTALGQLTDPDIDAQVERIELEMRLCEIDNHDWALDERIVSEEPPPLAYLMPAELGELAVTGAHNATARATLFYSPEAKFNVHGPIMLFHAATLAEGLLAPGETLSQLEATNFSKMVISQLRLTLFDADAEPPRLHRPGMAAASISGAFRTSAGRRLAFYGIPDPAWPVTRRCLANRIAVNLIPPGHPFERDGAAYIIRTPASVPPELWPEGGLGVPALLMTVLDTLMLMMLTQHIHADETRLLVSIRDLPMGSATLDELVIGTQIAFTPHVEKTRRVSDTLVMMPIDIRFARCPDVPTRVMVGESTLPYFHMPVG